MLDSVSSIEEQSKTALQAIFGLSQKLPEMIFVIVKFTIFR